MRYLVLLTVAAVAVTGAQSHQYDKKVLGKTEIAEVISLVVGNAIDLALASLKTGAKYNGGELEEGLVGKKFQNYDLLDHELYRRDAPDPSDNPWDDGNDWDGQGISRRDAEPDADDDSVDDDSDEEDHGRAGRSLFLKKKKKLLYPAKKLLLLG